MPRLLLVTYEFPPRGGPGVQRPVKLLKYLARLGWDASVVTVADPVTAVVDESLLADVPDSARVVRAWSLEPTRAVRALRSRRAPAVGGTGASGMPSGFVKLVQSAFVPDEKRYWTPWAVRAALVEAGRERPDVVVSTGPPHTAHLVASKVARRLGLPHVVDLRDPWVGYFNRRALTPVHAWLNGRMERRVMQRASAIVVVTGSMAEKYRARYPRLAERVHVVMNGFDPEDLQPLSAVRARGCRFVHTGVFSPPRSPRTFLEGLRLAEDSEPRLAEAVEVRFAGAGAEVESLAEELGVRSTVRGLGYLSHAGSLAQVAEAAVALILLSPGAESEVSLTGKVFEYLGLRKPILAVVGAGEVARLLNDMPWAVVADPREPRAVADAILRMAHACIGDVLERPRLEDAERFSRERQTERYAGILHSAVDEGTP